MLKAVSEFIEVDSIDKEIILLLLKGATSSYSVWSTMNKQAERNLRITKVLAYKNINQRVVNLAGHGYLEKVESDDITNIHGRLDFRVTLKAIEQLIPYILQENPEEIKSIVQYMNKFNMDKEEFGSMLSRKVISMIKSIDLYLGSTTYVESLPMDIAQIGSLKRAISELSDRLRTVEQIIMVQFSRQKPEQTPAVSVEQLEEYREHERKHQWQAIAKDLAKKDPEEIEYVISKLDSAHRTAIRNRITELRPGLLKPKPPQEQGIRTQLMKLPKLTPQQIETIMKTTRVPKPNIQEMIWVMARVNLTPQQMQEAVSHLHLKLTLQEIEDIIDTVHTQTHKASKPNRKNN